MDQNIKIGFIGQGFIGKNYADDFEERGFSVTRYDLEKYQANKDKIKDCDLVFIAVPTPTTPNGFNHDILTSVLGLIGKGKTAVIKSTIMAGTTIKLQKLYPEIIVMHSPEFLTEKTAAFDARNPERNIVGITDINDQELYKKAEIVLSVLPKCPYSLITKSQNAELIKYGGNNWFYFKVIFMNILYDLVQKSEADFEVVKEGMSFDSRIGKTHLDVVHQGGRGAGGHCFIKDFEAFIEMLDKNNLTEQKKVCEVLRNMNLAYLKSTNKNQDLVKEIYG